MRVSFDFDPTTKKVTNVNVEDGAVSVKKVPSKQIKTNSQTIVQNGGSLKLNQEVLDLLDLKPGDRVIINFRDGHPVLVTPEAANMEKGGNLISKSLTIAVKGKTSELLSQVGPVFNYTLESKGYLVLTNDTITELNTNYEATAVSTPEIDQQLLDQTDFKSTITDGVEIDFSFEI